MNTYPWNDLDMKAYNSFIYNSPKLEAIQQSINRGMTKSTVSYSHKGIRFSNHKEQILIHTTTWMHLTDVGLRTKARDERVPVAWSHSHEVQEEAKITYAGKIQNTLSREREELIEHVDGGTIWSEWQDLTRQRRELHECIILSELYI